MKIYKKENKISDLIKNNKIFSDVNYFINTEKNNCAELIKACEGNACAFAAIKDKDHKITDDIMPISSILVTDIWNANNDVFTAEEIIKASQTPLFKPINWMHRGSEDTENENIGVMVKSSLVHGDLPEINYMSDEDISNYEENKNTLSSFVHIKQDGLIWSQYFPTYASKVKNGINEGNIYVSMECFFEDFGYCLRKNEDDDSPLFIDRTEANAHMSANLTSYGGSGSTTYKGKKYQIGRWLKNIIFSGQGIVSEPANKRKGKILSVIIKNENKSQADIQMDFDPSTINPPTTTTQSPGSILNPQETQIIQTPQNPTLVSSPEEIAKNANLPKTYETPQDGLLFYTSKEAEQVGKIELGCTGYHVYLEDRHSDNPMLFAKLIGDPSDLENQMKIARYRPCDDERELRFILQDMAKKGLSLRRFGLLSETQTTSFQPSVPGGGGESIINTSGTPTSDTSTGLPGGTDTGMLPGQGQGSVGDNLINKNKTVYNQTGDIKLSNFNEEEIERVLDLAAEKIEEINTDNAEYENAIIKATSHIESLNKEILELREFVVAVEKIADNINIQKTYSNRKNELDELLGKEFSDISDEDLMSMDEKSYRAFKNSIAKIADSLDEKVVEIERANAAAKLVSKSNRPQTNSLVVAQQTTNITNTAQSLIGFAFSKKR